MESSDRERLADACMKVKSPKILITHGVQGAIETVCIISPSPLFMNHYTTTTTTTTTTTGNESSMCRISWFKNDCCHRLHRSRYFFSFFLFAKQSKFKIAAQIV